MLTVSPSLTFQHVPVDVENKRVGIRDAIVDLGNSYMCVYRKFGLGMTS